MTRLNFNILWLSIAFSIVCYAEASHNAYGYYFTRALDLIHERGLEKVDKQTLFDAAMRGMANEHDRYSAFISQEEKERYVGELDQHFSGIGIAVYRQPEDMAIIVASTVIGTPRPAHDAGMRSGDRIVSVAGQNVDGLSVTEVSSLIRGPMGEPVTISVIHPGDQQPETLRVVRADIAVDSVMGDMRNRKGNWIRTLPTEPRIAYLRLSTFGDLTSGEVRRALEQLEKRGQLHAMIVDVRDNVGGYLTAARETCDLFIDEGTIVTTRVRDGEIDKRHVATRPDTFLGFPMAVLINGESASASEIFAACLQDHQRAVIIGVRTYGKGSVQQMFPMERDRSLLKLTTASYWRPSGQNIHRLESSTEEDDWGVKPNEGFEVELTSEQDKQRFEVRRERDAYHPDGNRQPLESLLESDLQLKRAVEYLLNRLPSSDDAVAEPLRATG